MIPKFAHPHSLSQDVEITTRAEIAERAGYASIIHDEDNRTLKRNLDDLLRDTWADVFAETSRPSRTKRPKETIVEPCKNEGGRLAFRLVSSMKYPQQISLDPKPFTPLVSEGPDCEDDETQAETRRIRALSVAVDVQGLREVAVSRWQADTKSVTVETKVVLANPPRAWSLPPMLLIEGARADKTSRRVATGNLQDTDSLAVSPHEPRASCVVLPVVSVPKNREWSGKKRRKHVKERPQPSYWRPPPELRGKCMGYALGYPSGWSPNSLYVRDAMKRGVDSTRYHIASKPK